MAERQWTRFTNEVHQVHCRWNQLKGLWVDCAHRMGGTGARITYQSLHALSCTVCSYGQHGHPGTSFHFLFFSPPASPIFASPHLWYWNYCWLFRKKCCGSWVGLGARQYHFLCPQLVWLWGKPRNLCLWILWLAKASLYIVWWMALGKLW